MKYNFDKLVNRSDTDSVKYDYLKPLFGRDDLLPMWVADMDFEVPDFIRNAMIERMNHPVYGYSIRPPRFFESVSDWMERRHGWKVDVSEVDFSPGIVPALVLSVLGFTQPGDKILVQTPVYFPFFSSITSHKRQLINNQLLDKDGVYSIDFKDLEEKFKEGVKMMMFCHPHNPTGRAWNKEELQKVADLALKYDVLVLSDEIHSDLLLFGNKHIPMASLGPEIAAKTITCIAPSKTFNLAGLHTSAVIIQDKILKKAYEKIMNDIHVGGGNIFGAVALEAAYTSGDEWLDQLNGYLEQNFLFLKEYITKNIPGIRVSPLEATYLAWLNFESLGLSDEELMKFAVEDAKLALIDGPRFGEGGSNYLRMNIGLPKSRLESALIQLKEAVEKRFPKNT